MIQVNPICASCGRTALPGESVVVLLSCTTDHLVTTRQTVSPEQVPYELLCARCTRVVHEDTLKASDPNRFSLELSCPMEDLPLLYNELVDVLEPVINRIQEDFPLGRIDDTTIHRIRMEPLSGAGAAGGARVTIFPTEDRDPIVAIWEPGKELVRVIPKKEEKL